MAPSSTAQPPPPHICASSSTFATVVVAKEATPFVVHEDLLTYHSPFFRATFEGGFEEAANKKVYLEEVDKDTFELVVYWLYHQRFPTTNDNPGLFRMWSGDSGTGED